MAFFADKLGRNDVTKLTVLSEVLRDVAKATELQEQTLLHRNNIYAWMTITRFDTQMCTCIYFPGTRNSLFLNSEKEAWRNSKCMVKTIVTDAHQNMNAWTENLSFFPLIYLLLYLYCFLFIHFSLFPYIYIFLYFSLYSSFPSILLFFFLLFNLFLTVKYQR